MEYRVRILPGRETIQKTAQDAGVVFDPEATELVLSLANARNAMMAMVEAPLREEYGLTEGKFILLMALKSHPEGFGVKELADRVGVSVPAVSIMLRRILESPEPLVTVSPDRKSGRGKRVRIAEPGVRLIRQVLPAHLGRVEAFSSRLTPDERRELVRLLGKLIQSRE